MINRDGYALDRQFGFKSKRSTEDAILKLRDLVSGSQERHVIGILFDISGAFNNMWWPGLLIRLQERQCPRNLYRLISAYFSNRKVMMISDYGKQKRRESKGAPQGSVLGPVCWNLPLDNLLQVLDDAGIEVIVYSGITMVVIEARNRKEVKGQRALDIICRWCKENKLKISIPKPGFIYLKGWLRDTKRIKIILEGERLQHVSDTKYLGMIGDERLKVEKHVLDVASQSEVKFQKLSRLSRNEMGLRSGSKLKLYTSVFIPILFTERFYFHVPIANTVI